MAEIRTVLFVARPDVIAGQAEQVRDHLVGALGVEVSFASSPEDAAPGAHYDAVIAPTLPWLPELLHRLGGVSWVHFLSAGVDPIWKMDYPWDEVVLTKSSGVHAVPMSEYAIGAMLHFAKRFDQFVEQSRGGVWQRAWLDELAGRQLVVLGYGAVGQAVAGLAGAFGMDVHGVTRSATAPAQLVDGPATQPRAFIHPSRDLPELLADAHYVVVTLPLTPQTADSVNADFFARMQPEAVLVDMSRGGVVNSAALCSALDSGRLRGAALDVFEREPLPADSPLWGRPNVLLTPHVAGTTPRYLDRALEIFVQNAVRLATGAALLTPVDLRNGY